MPRRLVTLTLLAVVCQGFPATQAVALPPKSGGSAPAGRVGIQLLDAPVSRKNDPRAHVYIIDHLRPGAVIHRRVEVVNQTKGPEHFDLYPGGASIESGKFVVAEGRGGDELAGWISLDRPGLDVPAGGTAKALVTIRVPAKASKGERYAVVWAEVAAKPTAQHSVGVANRVGVRVYLDVGPGGDPRSDFRVEGLTARRGPNGVPELLATVHNTGERALDMTGSLALTDGPGGSNAGPFPVRPGDTPAPGGSVQVVVPLDPGLPTGPWNGKLTLRSGVVEHSVSARFTFPSAGRALNLSMSSRLPSPLLFVMSAGVLLLAAYCALLWYRRRRSTGQGG